MPNPANGPDLADGGLWLPSPHRSSRRGAAPRLIVVHCAEGIVDAARLGAWFAHPGSSVSTHAGADPAGRLGRYVPSALAAWSVLDYNRVALSVMLCTVAGAAVRYSPHDWRALRPMLDTAARWIGVEAAAAGIPLVKLDGAQARADGAAGVCGYEDLIPRATGPGPAFPWSYLLAEADHA
jgi:N-acetyl-anhydromuramyl-L-alanine amidase AmpD